MLNKSAALHMTINAAKGLQDVLKTNLGPKGTIKMSLSLSLFYFLFPFSFSSCFHFHLCFLSSNALFDSGSLVALVILSLPKMATLSWKRWLVFFIFIFYFFFHYLLRSTTTSLENRYGGTCSDFDCCDLSKSRTRRRLWLQGPLWRRMTLVEMAPLPLSSSLANLWNNRNVTLMKVSEFVSVFEFLFVFKLFFAFLALVVRSLAYILACVFLDNWNIHDSFITMKFLTALCD